MIISKVERISDYFLLNEQREKTEDIKAFQLSVYKMLKYRQYYFVMHCSIIMFPKHSNKYN